MCVFTGSPKLDPNVQLTPPLCTIVEPERPERIRQGGGGGGGEGGSGVEEEVKRARLFASSGVQAKGGKVDMDGLPK